MLSKIPENKRTAVFASKEDGKEMEIVLFALSMEYMHNVEIKAIKDGPLEALKDASNFSEEDILKHIRYPAANKLYDEIIDMTFGKDKGVEGEGDGKK